MEKLLIPLLLLPFGVFAQSDTLYVKGGTKYAVTIDKIEGGRIHFNTGTATSSMPETSVKSYYWPNKPAVPQKKDNVIVIYTEDTPDQAFLKMGKLLAGKNFPLTTANKEIGIINTGSKPIHGTLAVLLNVNFKEANGKTEIVLTGTYDGADIKLYGTTSEQKFPIHYATSGLNEMTRAWNEMDKVAKAYNGGKVSYGKW